MATGWVLCLLLLHVTANGGTEAAALATLEAELSGLELEANRSVALSLLDAELDLEQVNTQLATFQESEEPAGDAVGETALKQSQEPTQQRNLVDSAIIMPTVSCSLTALAIARTWGRKYLETQRLIFVVSKYDEPHKGCAWGNASEPDTMAQTNSRWFTRRFTHPEGAANEGVSLEVLFTKCPKGLFWVACSGACGVAAT
jgi:hypothetical protein